MAGLDFKQWLQFNYEFRGGTTECFFSTTARVFKDA